MYAPNHPSPAAPIVVVGPQFCAPYPVDVIVTKKFLSITDGDFTVKDVEGNDLFRVKGVFLSMRDRRVLQDAIGNPLITMQEKVLTVHKRWKVFRGDSTDDSDLLFSVKKSSLLQLKTKLDVFLAGKKEEVCDFSVKGSYFERSCTIYKGDSSVIVAQLRVTIYPNVDHAFIVALIVILDEINKRSGGGSSN
ncbi:unnamed protein product [Spirodela intermedia]|uniref:Uncharacterized protein n=1 Tax=Spirodela intermedia TaxID=51605 RepID=A0A7I8IBE8_SPIIN|nr:unnamed protein product [Spirodela intermedia]CAA6654663.1 unnamed protein product [Spirodela intermedia]